MDSATCCKRKKWSEYSGESSGTNRLPASRIARMTSIATQATAPEEWQCRSTTPADPPTPLTNVSPTTLTITINLRYREPLLFRPNICASCATLFLRSIRTSNEEPSVRQAAITFERGQPCSYWAAAGEVFV